MDHKDLCEHTRIRLIAAAVGHQKCTKTESNIIPLPGTDRVIAIGTPVQVRALLGTMPEPTIANVREFGAICDGVTDDTAALQRAAYWAVTTSRIEANVIEFGASLLGHSSETDALDDAEAHAWVRERWQEWSARAGLAGQVDSEGGHHD